MKVLPPPRVGEKKKKGKGMKRNRIVHGIEILPYKILIKRG